MALLSSIFLGMILSNHRSSYKCNIVHYKSFLPTCDVGTRHLSCEGIRVVSPRKVSRFAPLNRYYIIIDEVFFDNFLVIIYLLVERKKKKFIHFGLL